jgi:hypothetical protein
MRQEAHDRGDPYEALMCFQFSMSAMWNERMEEQEKPRFPWGSYATEKATGKRCRVVGSSVSYKRGGVVTSRTVTLWFLERHEDGTIYSVRRPLDEDEVEPA